MRYIVVRSRRRKLRHATSEGSDAAGQTLCGKQCNGWVVDGEMFNCVKCLQTVVSKRKR